MSLTPHKKDTIKVKGIKNEFLKIEEAKEFFSKYKITPIIVLRKKFSDYFFLFMGGFMMLLSVYGFIHIYNQIRREKKLMKLMKVE